MSEEGKGHYYYGVDGEHRWKESDIFNDAATAGTGLSAFGEGGKIPSRTHKTKSA